MRLIQLIVNFDCTNSSLIDDDERQQLDDKQPHSTNELNASLGELN